MRNEKRNDSALPDGFFRFCVRGSRPTFEGDDRHHGSDDRLLSADSSDDRKSHGQPFRGKIETHKAMPMYGGAWGWSCTYFASMRIEFSIYAEASSAKAKQDFDKLSIGADESKGKPSIGESAFWSNTDSTDPYLYVLKGKAYFLVSMSGTKRGDEKQMRETRDLAAAVAARI